MNESELKQYVVEFQKMQDKQIEDFNRLNTAAKIGDYTDLDMAIFERSRTFENLRNALSLASPSVLTSLKEDVDNILNKDRLFMATLENYKNELSKKINQSVKGKHLLKGYSTGTTKSLRFMNNKI
ncbi:MAG: hypothetical protein HQK73_10075 [Desulfamplus sp.]|nr:hypothetical protein [Desulfamplus sp.]